MRLFKNRKLCLVLIRTPLKVHLQGLLKRWDQSCVMARTRDPYCLRQPILPRRKSTQPRVLLVRHCKWPTHAAFVVAF